MLLKRVALAILLACLLPALSEARNIDKFVTGGWGDPTQSGHGLSIEVLNDSLAVAFWYSHNPDGTSMFLVMVGTIQGNTMSGNANYFSGMVFGDFDPATLIEETWGTFSISFHDCNTATLTYSSTMQHKGVPFGSGTVSLQKLVSPPGLHCSDNPLAGTYHFTEASLQGIGIGAGIIFENGDLAFFAQNNTQAFVGLGLATQTGPNTFNADVVRFDVSGGWEEIFGTGTINENGVVANYNGVTLTATTIASFRHRLPLQQLAGNWVVYDHTNANVGTVVISSTGQVTGTSATGCNISGSVIVPNELFNQFYVLVDISNCATPAEIIGGGIYDFDKDQIVALAADGFFGYVWELRK